MHLLPEEHVSLHLLTSAEILQSVMDYECISTVRSCIQSTNVWVWGDCVGRKREELTGLQFYFGSIQLQWSIQLSKVGIWMKLSELPHFLSNLCVPCARFVFVEKKHKLWKWFKDVPGGPVPRYLDSVEGLGIILCSKLKTNYVRCKEWFRW